MTRIGLEFRHADIIGGGTYVYFRNLEHGLRGLGLETERVYVPQNVAPSGVKHFVDRTAALVRRKRHIRRAAAGLDLFASPFPEYQRLRIARSFHCQDVAFLRTDSYRALFARYWKHQIARILDDYEHVIAISHATRADLVDIFGKAAERATVIHHGIGDEFHAVEEPLPRAGDGVLRLLWVGNYHRRKRLDYAFEILSALARIRPCALTIVGNLHAQLPADLAGGLDVTVRARISVAELIACYRSADALLWTSAYEGFGFPLVEAAACFCPVFAVSNSSVPEVLGGHFWEIPSGDAKTAAELLAATELQGADSVARMHAAKAFSRRLTWTAAAERTWSLWKPQLQIRGAAPAHLLDGAGALGG